MASNRWRTGPPGVTDINELVRLGPAQAVAAGGRDRDASPNVSEDTIYDVVPGDYTYSMRTETLMTARDLFAATSIPDGYVDCDRI